ncbi:hypothetical protein AYI69_g8211, partial [Smittium culicis]
MSLDSKS